MRLFRRKPPRRSADELVAISIGIGDYNAAATFILAGAAEVLVDAKAAGLRLEDGTETQRDRTLRAALATVAGD